MEILMEFINEIKSMGMKITGIKIMGIKITPEEFFTPGKFTLIIALLIVFSIFSKLLLSHLYKNLIFKAENMMLNDNGTFRKIKMRYESILEVSGGVADAKVIINRYLYNHRFCGITLNGMDRIAGLNSVLCVVAGSAWCWYFYRDTGEITAGSVYITVACTVAFALALFDKFFDAGHKHEMLENIIEDYLKNIYEPRYLKSHNISSKESARADKRNSNTVQGKSNANKVTDGNRIKEPLPEIAITEENAFHNKRNEKEDNKKNDSDTNGEQIFTEDTRKIIQDILNRFL